MPEPLGGDEGRKVAGGSGGSNDREGVGLRPGSRDGGGGDHKGLRRVGEGAEGGHGQHWVGDEV